MALNPSDLQSGMVNVFTSFPSTAKAGADGLANAYHSYASKGQSCAGLTPTVVNLPVLQSKIKEALELNSTEYEEIAGKFAEGYSLYWLGGSFGVTGLVTGITGTVSLKQQLADLWKVQSATLATFIDSSQLHATILDTFTRTVSVTDSAGPCGPAPII